MSDSELTPEERELILGKLKLVADLAQSVKQEFIMLRADMREEVTRLKASPSLKPSAIDAEQSTRMTALEARATTIETRLEIKASEMSKQIQTEVELAVLRLQASEKRSSRHSNTSTISAGVSIAITAIYLIAQLAGVRLPAQPLEPAHAATPPVASAR